MPEKSICATFKSVRQPVTGSGNPVVRCFIIKISFPKSRWSQCMGNIELKIGMPLFSSMRNPMVLFSKVSDQHGNQICQQGCQISKFHLFVHKYRHYWAKNVYYNVYIKGESPVTYIFGIGLTGLSDSKRLPEFKLSFI